MSEEEQKDTKPCPICGEEIKATAKKCKHCGSWLDGSNPEEEQKTPETQAKAPSDENAEVDAIGILKNVPKQTYIKIAVIAAIIGSAVWGYNYIQQENARNPYACDSEYATTELLDSIKYEIQTVANAYENYNNPSYDYWGFRIYKNAEDVTKIDDKTIGNKDVQMNLSNISENNIDKINDTRTRYCSGSMTLKFAKPMSLDETDDTAKSNVYTQAVKYSVKREFGNTPLDSVKSDSFSELTAAK